MKFIEINTPVTDEQIASLKIGDQVLLSGYIYTARDAAHKRMVELLDQGKQLPFDIRGQILYYVGPSPAKPGHVIGSAGPTSSYRMDAYTPQLLQQGLKGMIGKGARTQAVVDALVANKSVYFAAIGGAAALLAKSVLESEVIAYEDLGAEAIHKLRVKDLPVIVINDVGGNDLYDTARKKV